MKGNPRRAILLAPVLAALFLLTVFTGPRGWAAPSDVPLPTGVKAVWDLDSAWREKTPTRERISLNGLWRWQPARALTDPVPAERWGYFKVPGFWPGTSSYIQEDC